jgi:hypothetical protein
MNMGGDGLELIGRKALYERIRVLEAWIRWECLCPCCSELKDCLPDCTFREDHPPRHARMMGARDVLYAGLAKLQLKD